MSPNEIAQQLSDIVSEIEAMEWVPEGWTAVPRKATPDMIQAIRTYFEHALETGKVPSDREIIAGWGDIVGYYVPDLDEDEEP